MSDNSKIVHTARTYTRGGREHGVARSADGCLDVRLAAPGNMAPLRSTCSLQLGRPACSTQSNPRPEERTSMFRPRSLSMQKCV